MNIMAVGFVCFNYDVKIKRPFTLCKYFVLKSVKRSVKKNSPNQGYLFAFELFTYFMVILFVPLPSIFSSMNRLFAALWLT